ncbi:hypothetical protein SAMN04489760_111102 [Syntrophus gentianae]|uniref:Uncharacterized protein n=1 Tax=Syntrophus gentianae TaxID=43775 RepID=A0A1H7XQ61_9BACT|nr:hypothetical protein SAMN04489760_111102 [Syntrophus gentianae]
MIIVEMSNILLVNNGVYLSIFNLRYQKEWKLWTS